MPTQNQRPENLPDPAESRERAVPEKEPGLGKVKSTDNTPHAQPDQHLQSRKASERHREKTADETTDQADSVHPADKIAHGGRASADEAEAIGKVRRSPDEQEASRRQGGH